MYKQVPPTWQEAIHKGGFSNVTIVENRDPPSETIKRAKELWGDTRPDIFAAKWGFVWAKSDQTLRSSHFSIDLKKSSHSLWWFQHKMGAHAYHLGDRAKYYITDCTGLCSMCKHKVDYQHLFTWCPGIATYRAQWEQERPLCWPSEPADWLGFPSIRYDSLPQGEKKHVLQWLIQAAEIRRDALFNYIQHVYKGHRRKLEIHHTVRARIAYKSRPTVQAPEVVGSQLSVDLPLPRGAGADGRQRVKLSLETEANGQQHIKPRLRHSPHRVESEEDDIVKKMSELELGRGQDGCGADRNVFVNQWFAEQPSLTLQLSKPTPVVKQVARPRAKASRRDDLLCGLDAVNNILRHIQRQCIQRESVDEVMSHLAREEALLLQGGAAIDNAPDIRGNYSVDALQLVLRVYADAEVLRWTRGQPIQDTIYLLGNGYHWTVVVCGPDEMWWHWDGNHSSVVAIHSFLNWTGHVAVLAVKR